MDRDSSLSKSARDGYDEQYRTPALGLLTWQDWHWWEVSETAEMHAIKD